MDTKTIAPFQISSTATPLPGKLGSQCLGLPEHGLYRFGLKVGRVATLSENLLHRQPDLSPDIFAPPDGTDKAISTFFCSGASNEARGSMAGAASQRTTGTNSNGASFSVAGRTSFPSNARQRESDTRLAPIPNRSSTPSSIAPSLPVSKSPQQCKLLPSTKSVRHQLRTSCSRGKFGELLVTLTSGRSE